MTRSYYFLFCFLASLSFIVSIASADWHTPFLYAGWALLGLALLNGVFRIHKYYAENKKSV